MNNSTNPQLSNPSTECEWFLSGQLTDSDVVRDFPVHEGFTVGRRAECSLYLPISSISGNHARIEIVENECWLVDLNSTNGTFVNGNQVTSRILLNAGDLVQFAKMVFRVGRNQGRVESQTITEDTHDRALMLMQFDRLISEGGVYPHFQPLITLDDRKVFGYEILGRSKLFGLQTPKEMFEAASQLDLEAELSEVFRFQGIVTGDDFPLPDELNLFVNTHPKELGSPKLYDSLKTLRASSPNRLITLEIHEAATTNLKMMQELRAVLNDLNMQLAFDDFGVGKARLVEIAEVRPDYLKFDMELTQNLEQATAERQEVVAMFAKMVNELGIKTLAEGVETEACHDLLVEMGFDMGQGFLYGRPVPVTRLPEAINE